MEVKKRENWGSTLGFVLAIAGSAIGLGNVWKFPYITGQNGGGAFVLVYLFCIFFARHADHALRNGDRPQDPAESLRSIQDA